MNKNNQITNNTQKITPFLNFCVQNFPFIEDVYNAIDNYDMWCKLVAKMNEVIGNENQVIEVVTEISNYFNNLDVQDEINNKLDEMAQDGTLEQLISKYITNTLNRIYKTVNDMKNDLGLEARNESKNIRILQFK